MNNKIRVFNLLAIVTLLLGACNLPSGSDSQGTELELTFAAQTVEALLSQTPLATNTSLPEAATLTPTLLPVNTSTSVASATPTCNLAQFITDVNIPDGTEMTPGQTFTKKWRLKNIGTCAWNGYSMIFDNGDSMNGPASKAIAAVSPGQEVDLEVDLKAPNSAGSYRGYWRISTNGNVLVPVVNGYQGKSFYVDIKVKAAPTATNTLVPAIAQVILTNQTSEDGHVTSAGTTNQNPNVGDNNANELLQAFISFDMSPIPNGATITKVVVDFSSGYDTLGNPWSLGDGCLRAYSQNYGTLDSGDYFGGSPTGAYIRWCGNAELSSSSEVPDMISLVQSQVGSSRLQMRLQFTGSSNNNNTADTVRLGTMKLTVTYQ